MSILDTFASKHNTTKPIAEQIAQIPAEVGQDVVACAAQAAVCLGGQRLTRQLGHSQPRTPSTGPDASPAPGISAGLLTLLVLALIAGLSIAPLFPRTVAQASVSPDRFSAERALPHLQAIAAEPHPVGSAANVRVRDYLLGQIRTLGLEPQVQRAAVLNPRDGSGAVIENVLVRFPGTVSTLAVLFVAHYDSVVGAPGAGDNGMAVAAMVETLRALKAGTPLRNDLIFLFDDGEESGMLGATAFVQKHPWARDVAVVFDFDADGPVGPSVENPGKREEFGNDLHVFADAGYSGAHFDRVGGSTYYHSPRDNLAHLDPAALQHQGDAMLALARHFGNLPIGETRAADVIFVTLLGLPIISYPVDWALPLALFAALALTGAVALGLRRSRLTLRGLTRALLAMVGGLLAVALAGHLAWQPIVAAHPESRLFAESDFYGQEFYLGGLYVLVVALMLVAVPLLSRRLGRENVAVAGVAWLVAASLLLSVAELAGSFLAAWPALFGALGLLCLATMPRRSAGVWMWARVAVTLLGAVPAIGLLGATIFRSAIDGVGDGPAVPFGLLVLLLGVLAPQLDEIARLARRAIPAGVALAGIGLLVAGGLTSGYSAAQPRPSTLMYLLNADTGEAHWVSADPQVDEWTGLFLAGGAHRTSDELFGDGGSDMLRASGAPVAPLPPPALELIGMEAVGDLMTLRLRLTSPRGAGRAYLFPAEGTQLLAAGLEGDPPAPIQGDELQLAGLPAGGLDLALGLRAAGPVRFTVVDLSTGLPGFPGMTLPPPPETVMSAPNPAPLRGYPTAVRASVVFGRTE
jgi:hypothetical protein